MEQRAEMAKTVREVVRPGIGVGPLRIGRVLGRELPVGEVKSLDCQVISDTLIDLTVRRSSPDIIIFRVYENDDITKERPIRGWRINWSRFINRHLAWAKPDVDDFSFKL